MFIMYRRFLLCLCLFLPAWVAVQGQGAPKRENLDSTVNSAFDEIYPVISADGRILYFDRKGHPGNTEGPKDDIWYSELQPDGTWGRARNIGWPLNTRGPNYVCAALPDNNTLLLGNQYLSDGTQALGVSMTFRTRTGWQTPTALVIEKFRNDNKSGLAEYTISPDGSVLVMAIETPESLGGRDLYVSFQRDDGTWGEPRHMGPDINTAGSEITPFIAADGKTLYFSSDRPGGFGKNDVWMARRLDSTWRRWTLPMNLGSPVNSPGWDAYYTVPASGEYAYFVSTSEGFGRSDIFRIRLPKEAKPEPVLLVAGRVHDLEDRPVSATIVFERFSDGRQIAVINVNPANGEFTMALPIGEMYGFRAVANGYYPVSQNVDARQIMSYTEVRRDLILVPIRTGNTVTLNNIFFAFDQAALDTSSQLELNRLVAFLRQQPDVRIEISGHTDDVGEDAYNLRLSTLRAQAVVDYLISQGIAATRLNAIGYGKTRPVADNTSEEGRKTNRRVEFTIK